LGLQKKSWRYKRRNTPVLISKERPISGPINKRKLWRCVAEVPYKLIIGERLIHFERGVRLLQKHQFAPR